VEAHVFHVKAIYIELLKIAVLKIFKIVQLTLDQNALLVKAMLFSPMAPVLIKITVELSAKPLHSDENKTTY
jgi:hypothetical protein